MAKLLAALAHTPRHPDLTRLVSVGGVQIVTVPTINDQPAGSDFQLFCDDGATLAIRYLSLSNVLDALRNGAWRTLLACLCESPATWNYLLIGGVPVPNQAEKIKIDDTVTGWLWSAYQGGLLTAQELGIGVIHMIHADKIEETLLSLVKRERGPVKAEPARVALFLSVCEQILAALPDIGESRAEVIAQFVNDSPADALMALTSEYVKIEGIGPATKAKARAALGIKDGWCLMPQQERDLTQDEKIVLARKSK